MNVAWMGSVGSSALHGSMGWTGTDMVLGLVAWVCACAAIGILLGRLRDVSLRVWTRPVPPEPFGRQRVTARSAEAEAPSRAASVLVAIALLAAVAALAPRAHGKYALPPMAPTTAFGSS